MSKLRCEKAQNCFVDSETYQYELPGKVTEETLSTLAVWGELKVRRNLRRPFYQVTTQEQVVIKGIIGDRIVKVSYPQAGWEKHKALFEKQLETLQLE